jgi:hypothetical protein
MKRVWVIAGAIILAISFLMPLVFISLRFLPFGVLDRLSMGFDTFCCCGMSLPFMVLGAGTVLFGMVRNDTEK